MQSQLLYKTPRQIAEENKAYKKGFHYPLTPSEILKNSFLESKSHLSQNIKELFSNPAPMSRHTLSMMMGMPFPSFSNATLNRAAGAGGVTGWKKLASTKLGTANANIDISGFDNKRYYMILHYGTGYSGFGNLSFRMGNGSIDTSAKYSSREGNNNSADAARTSETTGRLAVGYQDFDEDFSVSFLANLSAKEKLMIANNVASAGSGAGSIPNRNNAINKYAFTSNPIDIIRRWNDTNTQAVDSEMVLLGYDPADTHTEDVWEELASVTGDGTSTTLDTGTFTAKKYLWIQAYLDGGASSLTTNLWRFNSDSGSNYSSRYSRNGTEGTNSSITHLNVNITGASTYANHFYNGFMINNSATEKLSIIDGVVQNTAGAGNALARVNATPKWANTSSQITSMQIVNDNSVNFTSKTFLKIWGFD